MRMIVSVLALAIGLAGPGTARAQDTLDKLTGVLKALAKPRNGPKDNLVVNGGFEQPVVQSGLYVTSQSGQAFEDWQVIGQAGGVARNDQVIDGQQGWGLFRMQVTATGNTMTLAFINRDPPNDNSNGLDAVSLVPARAAAAPSPGAATAATPDVPQVLSDAETGAVFQAAGFSQRGGQWRSACDDPTPTYGPGSVDSVADLNGDGRPEAVIVEGGIYCYGNTGQGYWLMSQQADGSWKLMSNGIGIVEILTTKGHAGWPDLSIGGPGFCFPVLRWNGQSYAQHRWEYDRKACSPPR